MKASPFIKMSNSLETLAFHLQKRREFNLKGKLRDLQKESLF